jgi:hypothetical protein
MRGRILGADASGQATVIGGEDGRRYRFSSFEWRETTPPARGEEVDFEPDAPRARDVYRIAAAPAALPLDETPAELLSRQPFVRFFVARPVLTTSLLVLLACLAGAYVIDGARLSLLAALDLAWRMSMGIDVLLAGSGPDPGPRLAGAAARIATVLLLLLYAVPALAAIVAWREFVGRPDPRLARLAGVAAMVLPVALPALVVVIVRLGVLPGVEVPLRLGRDGVSAPANNFHPVSLFAGGTVLVMLAGLALWAAASGRLEVWLTAAIRPREKAIAHLPKPVEDDPAGYAPQRRRQPPLDASREWRGSPPSAAEPAPNEHVGGKNEEPTDISRDAMAALTEQLKVAISGERGEGQPARHDAWGDRAAPERRAERPPRAAAEGGEPEGR